MSKISVTTIAGLTSGGDANKVKIETGDDLEVVNGDLTVDTNTLHVSSSSDRVGIGTTSPSYPLTISHATTAYHHSTNGTAQSVSGVDSANTNIIGTISNHDLRFITNTTERGRITADGHFTQPSQPSFRVGGNNANWVSVTSGNTSIIEFDGNVYHNVGSHYSTTNDRFVAPIAGRYLIGFHAYVRNNAAASDGTSAYGYVRLYKNGGQLSSLNHIFGYANHTDNDIQMSLQTVVELAANDYMQVALSGIGGTVQHYGSASEFYGHLLG